VMDNQYETGDRAPATTARAPSKKCDFCSELAASAAGYVHGPRVTLEGIGFIGFGVVRSAMDNDPSDSMSRGSLSPAQIHEHGRGFCWARAAVAAGHIDVPEPCARAALECCSLGRSVYGPVLAKRFSAPLTVLLAIRSNPTPGDVAMKVSLPHNYAPFLRPFPIHSLRSLAYERRPLPDLLSSQVGGRHQ
jgi:hypothetical protein